jgi:DNA polymerase-1
MHNSHYDLERLAEEGVVLPNLTRDTIIEGHLLGHRPLALASLSRTFLGEELDKSVVKERKEVRFAEREQETLEVCSKDAWASRELAVMFEPRMQKYQGLLAEEREVTSVLRDMERTGLPIDQDRLKKASTVVVKGMARCEAVMRAHGLDSPGKDDLVSQKFWRGKRNLIHTTEGALSTKKVHLLEAMTPAEEPWVRALIEWRQLRKFRSTYLSHWRGKDFVHASLNQTGTATWRLSCSDPNLQNVPKIKEVPLYTLFTAPPGYVFISADYSQIELRVLAVLSQDRNMLKAYRDGLDLHTATVQRLHLVEWMKGDEDLARRFAKVINFGIAYGITEHGLGPRLRNTVLEKLGKALANERTKEEWQKLAAKLIAAFYSSYPDVHPWQAGQIEFAQETGYVETLKGRPLWIPGLMCDSGPLFYHARNQCVNYQVQGGATEIMKDAMRRCPKYLVMSVHDELLYLVPEREAPDYLAYLTEALVDKRHEVPYTIEIHMGKSWGELKNMKDVFHEEEDDE